MSLIGHKFQVFLSIKRDDGNALVFYKFNVEPTNGANLEKVPMIGSTAIPKTRFLGSTSETVQTITMIWYFCQPINAKLYLIDIAQDGQRFENDITIKMKVQTPYKLLLTVRPPQKIKLASMKGEELEMTSEEVNSESTKYAFEWNSNNIPVTKKNRRLSFNLILEIQNMGVLELPLQMKFYNATDTNHSAWGKSLNHIEFNCMHKTGNSLVEILSTVYR